MKLLSGLLLAVTAGACLAADATYKWVDEKGVTNYGEKPPQSRSSQSVNTNPSGIIEGGGQFSQKALGERRPSEEAPRTALGPPPLPGPMAVRGMEFDVYIRLQYGMSEGELLLRAGRPDHVGLDNLYDIGKSYYYFPTVANPFTTVVTLRGGRIASLERIKKF